MTSCLRHKRFDVGKTNSRRRAPARQRVRHTDGGRVCLCDAVQALGRSTLGHGVVLGSVGENPRFWHHCFEGCRWRINL